MIPERWWRRHVHVLETVRLPPTLVAMDTKACAVCTYDNLPAATQCEMCGTPFHGATGTAGSNTGMAGLAGGGLASADSTSFFRCLFPGCQLLWWPAHLLLCGSAAA